MLLPTTIDNFSSTDPAQSIENQKIYIEDLPNELLLRILRSLSLADLGKAACVCKAWNELSSDSSLWQNLGKFFPYLHVFDEKSWKACDSLSQLRIDPTIKTKRDNRAIAQILKNLFKLPEINGREGLTLLTIPKGLSLNKLKTFFPSLDVSPSIMEEFGNISVGESYEVIITNEILNRSRTLTAQEHYELVGKIGCAIPSLLEAATLTVVTYLSSSTYLLKPVGPGEIKRQIPIEKLDGCSVQGLVDTYTRCREKSGSIPHRRLCLSDLANIVVGSPDHSDEYNEPGLKPTPTISCCLTYDLEYGTMAVRRLNP